MAQVARAHTEAAGGDPRALKRLSVQFRGMGFPEQEIVVTATIREASNGHVVTDTDAAQGDNRIIRNAEAELRSTELRRRQRRSATPPTASARLSDRRARLAFRAAGQALSHATGRRLQPPSAHAVLTPRIGGSCFPNDKQRVLSLVVDSYLESGKPVGSKSLAGREEVEWSASTIRAELAELERAGYLTHPHTSAGRVPTDAGYRFYADTLLASGLRRQAPPGARPRRDAGSPRGGRGDARDDAELSRITDLLALATAPPPSAAASTGSRCCCFSRAS